MTSRPEVAEGAPDIHQRRAIRQTPANSIGYVAKNCYQIKLMRKDQLRVELTASEKYLPVVNAMKDCVLNRLEAGNCRRSGRTRNGALHTSPHIIIELEGMITSLLERLDSILNLPTALMGIQP